MCSIVSRSLCRTKRNRRSHISYETNDQLGQFQHIANFC
jgi:hypothetical protein